MSVRELLDDLSEVVRDRDSKSSDWDNPTFNTRLLPGIDFGGPIAQVLHYERWRIVAPATLPAELADPIAAAQALVDRWKEGHCDPFGQAHEQLLVLRPSRARDAGFVMFLDPQVLDTSLRSEFPQLRLTPALMRLLVSILAGVPLKRGGAGNARSAETRKTQARELRNRFGLATTEEVARIVGAFILRLVEVAAERRQRPDSSAFHAHIERYYPEEVQPLVIQDRDAMPHRVLAMGPVGGRALIMLHPLVLPSISRDDIAELHRLNLRLFWPLRIGQLAPQDAPASEDETICHAIRGIDLVRRCFCGPMATVVSIAASSKVALAYARHHPERVDMVCAVAACVLRGRPQTASRRLASSILAILDRAPWLADGVLRIVTQHLLSERRFRRFLTEHFAESPSDSAVIRYELDDVAGGRRMKEALELSLRSIRNDFAFQQDLKWDQLRLLRMPVHIVHGAQDSIHPLPLIRDLVADLPEIRLHVMPGTGQLLMGESLRQMFRLLAGIPSQQAGSGPAQETVPP